MKRGRAGGGGAAAAPRRWRYSRRAPPQSGAAVPAMARNGSGARRRPTRLPRPAARRDAAAARASRRASDRQCRHRARLPPSRRLPHRRRRHAARPRRGRMAGAPAAADPRAAGRSCCRPAGSSGSMAATTTPAPRSPIPRPQAEGGAQPRPLHLIFGMLNTKDPCRLPEAPGAAERGVSPGGPQIAVATPPPPRRRQHPQPRATGIAAETRRHSSMPLLALASLAQSREARPHPHLRLALSCGRECWRRMGRGGKGGCPSSGQPASLSRPSWSAKADHPRVCKASTHLPAGLALAFTAYSRGGCRRTIRSPSGRLCGRQTRGWSAFADHDGRESEPFRPQPCRGEQAP